MSEKGADVAFGPLERVVGHWIAAGVGDTAEVAAGLGLDPRHVARPLRTLVRAGAVEPVDGAWQLTPRGEAWLRLAPAAASAPAPSDLALPPLPELAPLDPVELAPGEDAEPMLSAEPLAGSATKPRLEHPADLAAESRLATEPCATGAAESETEPFGAGSPELQAESATAAVHRVWWAWRVRPALARLGAMRRHSAVALPHATHPLRLPPLVRPSRRALLPAALVGVLAVSVGGGWFVTSLSRPSAPAPTVAPTPVVAPLLTPPIPPTSAPEPTPAQSRRLQVVGTDGLGVVLRSAPGAAQRLQVLPEGARVQTSGETAQQGGRAWTAVTASDGIAGWVATEFLRPE